ncbi:MAG: DUF1460 domain-containing protein [Alphaproteobacteria bacterium]|uniref:DUF1460 domain-containing protein n=1 Tax=Candidatus Nitrobium versatile TaxID=2884831 RepID=A0A953M0J4_9BACT|nr:DUF1460 domain-containing protein [Candidatus Nitrobium versatile]
MVKPFLSGDTLIQLGKWTEKELDALLRAAASIPDTGRRIVFLSGHFLDTAYRESTLTGDSSTPEKLVVNLKEVDCFTFIDYIEAMRLSSSFDEFVQKLKGVRYRDGTVSYENRNHFFTDWSTYNAEHVTDSTARIGGCRTVIMQKRLNEREDGSLLLQDIPAKNRNVAFIPSPAVDREIIDVLRTGDYLGIYSGISGLDVSHVGIFIRAGGKIYLRHASSARRVRKVVDQEFERYLKSKPGIVVLRPKE